MNHQKKINEVDFNAEVEVSKVVNNVISHEVIKNDFQYQILLNTMDLFLEKGLMTNEEKVKIELQIRTEMEPYLYELHPL